jgi:hypothetical protein
MTRARLALCISGLLVGCNAQPKSTLKPEGRVLISASSDLTAFGVKYYEIVADDPKSLVVGMRGLDGKPIGLFHLDTPIAGTARFHIQTLDRKTQDLDFSELVHNPVILTHTGDRLVEAVLADHAMSSMFAARGLVFAAKRTVGSETSIGVTGAGSAKTSGVNEVSYGVIGSTSTGPDPCYPSHSPPSNSVCPSGCSVANFDCYQYVYCSVCCDLSDSEYAFMCQYPQYQYSCYCGNPQQTVVYNCLNSAGQDCSEQINSTGCGLTPGTPCNSPSCGVTKVGPSGCCPDDCTTCYPDCTGKECGTAKLDCAGVCNGNTKVDCQGVCGGYATYDACGVCGGDGTSCCAYSCGSYCYDACGSYQPQCCY